MPDLEWRSKLSVLVVDDGADSRASMKTLLTLHGYQSHAAPSGPDALRMLEYQWPDVILLDLRMPGMDGYQVAKHIRGRCGSQPRPLIIAVTGLAGDLGRVCSRLEGIDHHLLKPLDFAELDGLIDQWRSVRHHSEPSIVPADREPVPGS